MFASAKITGPSVLSEVADTNADDRHGMLSYAGRDPNYTKHSFRRHSESVGARGPRHVRDSKLELSRSVKYLYQKFDDVKLDGLRELDCQSEDVPGSKVNHRVSYASSDEHRQSENDDIDFNVVDQGIETYANDQLKNKDNSGTAIDALAAEENHISENEQISVKLETSCNTGEDRSNQQENVMEDCGKGGDINAANEGHKSEKRESECDARMLSDSFDLDNYSTGYMALTLKNLGELGSSFKSHRLVRSYSLDDLAEAVVDDFLDMLGADCSPYALSSDSEPGSPRERLLRQFEMEAEASGNYIFDADPDDVETQGACSNTSMCGTHNYLEDFRLTVCQTPEKYMMRIPSLTRRKAKAVEKSETEDLLKKWGLNETTFVYSPHRKSGGFGSPIYCSDEETPDLPSLGDGLGPIIQTHCGGFLRSISPSICRAAKHNSRLIMQVTSQKVLPAE